ILMPFRDECRILSYSVGKELMIISCLPCVSDQDEDSFDLTRSPRCTILDKSRQTTLELRDLESRVLFSVPGIYYPTPAPRPTPRNHRPPTYEPPPISVY